MRAPEYGTSGQVVATSSSLLRTDCNHGAFRLIRFSMMLIVSSATFGIALIPSTSSDLLQERFMPGHAQLFKMYDSSYQRLGHKVGLMLLGFTLLTAIVLGNRRQAAHRTPSAAELKFAKRLNQSLGGFLLAGILIRGLGDGISPSSVFHLLASLLMVVACIRFSAYISRKQFLLAMLMAVVYLIYLIAPLLFTIPRTSRRCVRIPDYGRPDHWPRLQHLACHRRFLARVTIDRYRRRHALSPYFPATATYRSVDRDHRLSGLSQRAGLSRDSARA